MIGLTWGYQAIVLVTGLWLTRHLLAHLGEGVLGWWAQAVAVLGYLGMADLGLNSLLPREVAAAVGRSGPGQRATELPAVIAQFAKFALWQTPLAAVLAVGCWLLLVGNGEGPPLTSAALLAAAVLAFPLRVAAGVLSGVQDIRLIGGVQIGVYLIGVAVTVGAVAAGFGATGLVVSWTTQSFLTAGLLWGRLATRHRWALPNIREVWRARVSARLLADGGWAWMAALGVGLAGTAEILVVGWFAPAEVVFRYSCTTKVLILLSPVALTLCQGALPGLTQLRASGDTAGVRRATLAYTQLILGASGLFGVVILATNAGFVGWWVGADKYLGDEITWLAVVGMNLRHWLNAMAVTLFCLNRERPLWRFTLIDGVVSMAATAGWVAWGGPAFAPLGPLTAVGGVTLPALLWVLRRDGTVSARRMLRSVGWWAVVYAPVAAGAVYVGRAVRPDDLVSLAAVGATVGAAYLAVMAVPTLRSELGEYLRPQLRSIGIGRVKGGG